MNHKHNKNDKQRKLTNFYRKLIFNDTDTNNELQSLDEVYRKKILKESDIARIIPDLTPVYESGLEVADTTLNQNKRPNRLLASEVYDPKKRRGIIDNIVQENYKKPQAKTIAELRHELETHGGMNSTDAGDTDIDYLRYIQTAQITDPFAMGQIKQFILGAKTLGIWQNIVCWPLISTQNRGTGTTVYSFGGLAGDTNSLSGSLIGGPSWNTGGINFSQSPSYQWMTSSILQQLTAAGTTTFGLLGVADFSTVILSALPAQQFIGSRGLFGGGTNYLGIAAGRASLTDARVKTITDIDAIGNFQPGGIPTGYSFMGSTANTNLTSYTPFIDGNSSLITGNSALSASNNYTFAVGGTPGAAPQQGWYGNVAFAMAFSAPVANYNTIRTLYKSTLGSSLNLP